jgi:multisubunit Na+/H+ antiporter MnhB subunit
MSTDLQLSALLLFMFFGAVIAVEGRDLLSSVISAGLVGFGASAGFLLLGAPELAITQVVVEITCLIILIRATVVRDETVVHRYRDTFASAAGMITLAVILMTCLVVCSRQGPGRSLPPLGQPVALQPLTAGGDGKAAAPRGNSRRILDEHWRGGEAEGRPGNPVHLANRVTAVLLDFRAYDTLGQAAIFLAAVVGALVVLRRKEQSNGRNEQPG